MSDHILLGMIAVASVISVALLLGIFLNVDRVFANTTNQLQQVQALLAKSVELADENVQMARDQHSVWEYERRARKYLAAGVYDKLGPEP